MHAITSVEVPYEADGLTMVGYLARPSSRGRWPALLMGHDGVGLDDYQKGRAEDLATRGYIVFAMDFHGGQTFFGRPEAMLARTMPLLAEPERMRAIGRLALDALLANKHSEISQLFAIGYGAGGHIVVELAQSGISFDAIALIHPSLPKAEGKSWHGTKSKVFLCTGSEDPICTPYKLLEFGQVLQNAGADWRVHIYGGAKHAFWACPTGPDGTPTDELTHVHATVPGVGYHPDHTRNYWRAILQFFEERHSSPAHSPVIPSETA